ncbi:DNA-processing protein DprA [Streptomyces sp. NPDC059071]|uniref:DNA-processing protein DprA n=1 Tax=unclassified Streptomyces TaxID=2593676 RepID=UPI00365B1838
MTTPSDEERLARAALTHIIEPGDAHAGRALRRHGATHFLRLLTDGDHETPPADADNEAPFPATGDPPDARGTAHHGQAALLTHPGDEPNDSERTHLTRRETHPPHHGRSHAAATSHRAHDSTAFPGTSDKRIASWQRRARTATPERDLDHATRLGARFLIPGDTEWPTQLDDLGDTRPIGLWVRGPADLRTWALRSVAVVGARACTPYGAHTAATLAVGLAERGWVVVSGAAFGIDGAAHRGALGSGGATVAVLACGVDVPYPRGHAALIRRITEQGLVIGELPPGGHPTRSRFILRNRVIAALTRGTVVVEAEYRSGSLVTARAAADLGRHTMGVPGPVTSGLSAGVHELLRGDATLVTDAAEIIELVGDLGQFAPPRHGPVLPRDLLDPDTTRILEALPGHHPAPLADIAARAAADPDHTLAKLYELHSLGFVERQHDDWRLTNRRTQPSNARHGGT